MEQQLKLSFPDSLKFGLQLMRTNLFEGYTDTYPEHLELEDYPQNKVMMLEAMQRCDFTCPFAVDQIIVYAIWRHGMPDGFYPYVYYFINADEGLDPLIYTFCEYTIDFTPGPILLDKLWNGPYHMKVLDIIEYTLEGMSFEVQ